MLEPGAHELDLTAGDAARHEQRAGLDAVGHDLAVGGHELLHALDLDGRGAGTGDLRAHAVEAAEQCERTALPALAEPRKLEAVLKDWPANRALYFADEGGGEAFVAAPGPAAILIGPEGGFTDEERNAIRALPQAKPVSLGPRILRADTAALTAISLWMAAAGDWRSQPRRG